jgi:hypothetical protein
MPIQTTEDYIRYSPFDAAMLNKSGAENAAFLKRFSTLPGPVRTFITSLETAEKVHALEETRLVPSEFIPAVAKLICLCALGDVKEGQIPSLLQKINFPSALLTAAAGAIADILRGAVAARAAAEAPLLKPLQPLVTHAPAADSAPASARGILDLRKPAP